MNVVPCRIYPENDEDLRLCALYSCWKRLSVGDAFSGLIGKDYKPQTEEEKIEQCRKYADHIVKKRCECGERLQFCLRDGFELSHDRMCSVCRAKEEDREEALKPLRAADRMRQSETRGALIDGKQDAASKQFFQSMAIASEIGAAQEKETP